MPKTRALIEQRLETISRPDACEDLMSANISVNARAAALVGRLIADAAELKIGVTRARVVKR